MWYVLMGISRYRVCCTWSLVQQGYMILITILLQEYKLLHPVVSKHERERQKRQKDKEALLDQFDEIEVSFVKICFVAVFRLNKKRAILNLSRFQTRWSNHKVDFYSAWLKNDLRCSCEYQAKIGHGSRESRCLVYDFTVSVTNNVELRLPG